MWSQACSAGTYLRTRTHASHRVSRGAHAWRAPELAELRAPAAQQAGGHFMNASALTRPAAPSRLLTGSAAELLGLVGACLRSESADDSVPVTLFAAKSFFICQCGEPKI